MKLYHLIHEAPSGRILLMVLAMLFTLCVGPANSASEPGTVTIVVRGEPENIDPGSSISRNVYPVIAKNIMETLTESNRADSSISPGLATSWKQIDPTTWHFFLRKGVKFHDGKDFNAEAVVFNIKRMYDQATSSVRSTYFTRLKLEGKALSSHTLELKMDKPEPLLPAFMATLAICSPNTPIDKWTRNPIGTGPYKFVKWDAGVQIILERFDGYWGKRPQVKKAIYIWRGESSVRASMVAIGEADLAPEIAIQDATRPDMDYSYLNAETSSLKIGGVWEPPLNDRRVRMALNYAVDRGAIRGSILSKDVVPATQMVVPSTFGYNPDLKVWPYDPQKARQLVDEARKDGVPVDKEISLVSRIGFFPGSDELMEALLTMYKAVGLNVKPKIVEVLQSRSYLYRPYTTIGGPYIYINQHDNNKGDAAFTVFFRYHCDGTQTTMCDKEVDYLIEKAQVATGEVRKKLWQAAFKRIHEEIVPDVVLFHMVGYCRVGKRINFKPSVATTSEIPLAEITFKP